MPRGNSRYFRMDSKAAMRTLIAATRRSQLALWQTHNVCGLLRACDPDLSIQMNEIQTKGDIILDRPLNEIGGKALFMKELEVAMLQGEADFAVHSLKDVPYELPNGFRLAAFCKRHNPLDALVSNQYQSLDALPNGAIVGTSSLRRKAQLLHYRSDLQVHSLRGNVQTRLKKLDEGQYDAIILAAAGLERLGLKARIAEYIDPKICVPAVGQGVVVVESKVESHWLNEQLAKINHAETEQCVLAERSFNESLQGGCHVPVAAHAVCLGGKFQLVGMVASENGQTVLKHEAEGGNPVELGQQVAQVLIEQGARSLLG